MAQAPSPTHHAARTLNGDRPVVTMDIDDVLAAHEILKNYAGDANGLFSSEGTPLIEWRMVANCPLHGIVANVLSLPSWQPYPSTAATVMCPTCLEQEVVRRIKPSLMARLTLGTGTMP